MTHKRKLDKSQLEIRCTTCDYVTFRQVEMDKHLKVALILNLVYSFNNMNA